MPKFPPKTTPKFSELSFTEKMAVQALVKCREANRKGSLRFVKVWNEYQRGKEEEAGVRAVELMDEYNIPDDWDGIDFKNRSGGIGTGEH